MALCPLFRRRRPGSHLRFVASTRVLIGSEFRLIPVKHVTPTDPPRAGCVIAGPLDAGPSHEEPPLRNLLARLARVRLQTLKPDDVRAAATSRACCLRVTARAGAPRHATVRFDTSIEATAACPKQSE
eukprot:1856439-Pyramimonas_sp.AAC.2